MPFHSSGLWLAVTTIPPTASDLSTINCTVGVGTTSQLTISLPRSISSLENNSRIFSPDGLESLPM